MQDSRYQSSQQHPQASNLDKSDKVDAEERVDLYSVVREMREVQYGETRVARLFYAASLNEFEKNKDFFDKDSFFFLWKRLCLLKKSKRDQSAWDQSLGRVD